LRSDRDTLPILYGKNLPSVRVHCAATRCAECVFPTTSVGARALTESDPTTWKTGALWKSGKSCDGGVEHGWRIWVRGDTHDIAAALCGWKEESQNRSVMPSHLHGGGFHIRLVPRATDTIRVLSRRASPSPYEKRATSCHCSPGNGTSSSIPPVRPCSHSLATSDQGPVTIAFRRRHTQHCAQKQKRTHTSQPLIHGSHPEDTAQDVISSGGRYGSRAKEYISRSSAVGPDRTRVFTSSGRSCGRIGSDDNSRASGRRKQETCVETNRDD
jgi:hypothetical protein